MVMVPCLHQGNIYSKRKLRVWRDQNCIPLIDAVTRLTCAGRHNTPSRWKQYRAQKLKVCVNCGGPISMVPCLHQGNIYTKRKLRVWRDQNCIPLVGAITPLTCPGRQNTLHLDGGSTEPKIESCVNCVGTTSMVPCLHQGNIYTKRKLRVWRDQKCIRLVGPITPLNYAGRHNTQSRGRQYRAQIWKVS